MRGILKSLQELTIEKWRKEFERYLEDMRRVELADPYVLSDCAIIRSLYRGPPGFLFLEAGCGSARDSLTLAKNGAQVVGLDIVKEALLVGRELFEHNDVQGQFVLGDILHLPFKEDVFDVIFCGGSIEHFEDTLGGIRELVRILAKDGLLIATVPLVSLSTLIYSQFYGNIPDLPVVRCLALFLHHTVLRGKYMKHGYEKAFTKGRICRIFRDARLSDVQAGLYETTYSVKLFGNLFTKKIIRRLAHLRPFWPCIWVKGEKHIE